MQLTLAQRKSNQGLKQEFAANELDVDLVMLRTDPLKSLWEESHNFPTMTKSGFNLGFFLR